MDQWGRDEAHMKESTLNRADLLTLSPVLRHSLGSSDNQLSFRELIDSGRSLIVNLALPHHDARHLFGCLLTVGMESAALARADNLTERVPHHLVIEVFSTDWRLTGSWLEGVQVSSPASVAMYEAWGPAMKDGFCQGTIRTTRTPRDHLLCQP